MTSTSVAWIQQFSPDDGHMDARNMYRGGINKYIKQNCAPSWIYLRDYRVKHGQQNKILLHLSFAPSLRTFEANVCCFI